MVAAFSTVMEDTLLAAAGGLACFGLAAEGAAQSAHGPASFKMALLDQLYCLSPETLARGVRMVELTG
jgi:hydroxyethylthiazole kinase